MHPLPPSRFTRTDDWSSVRPPPPMGRPCGLVGVATMPAAAAAGAAHNAPVAQRIERRPPEPEAQVRVLPGALAVGRGAASGDRGRRIPPPPPPPPSLLGVFFT